MNINEQAMRIFIEKVLSEKLGDCYSEVEDGIIDLFMKNAIERHKFISFDKKDNKEEFNKDHTLWAIEETILFALKSFTYK